MKQIYKIIALTLFTASLFLSCAGNPPKEERESAEKAFKSARAGKDCDKENYLAAEELLNRAREEVNNKNYDKAKELFIAAKNKSDEVVKYYRENPDKCLPGKNRASDEEENDEIEEESVEDPTKDPEMEFPVIHFEYNEYAILEEDMEKIDAMGKWMANFPERAVRIEGHADERGTIDYNLSLGEKRALAVKNRLIQSGINAQRIKIVSYGEERPIDAASNEEAWSLNRRAEFKRVN